MARASATPGLAAGGFGVANAPEGARELRAQVRSFLADARAAGRFEPRCDAWMSGHSPAFSRELGQRGWVGMTLPARFGGGDRSSVERFVVVEELLAAGAPIAAHWFADRQSAGQLLRHGSADAQAAILPAVARGECYFAIGMSEAESGSDLASVRTSARRVPGGWEVTGTKLWTSHAHRSHYLTVLCRTGPAEPTSRAGLSVLIVDLAATGVAVHPIATTTSPAGFNEVVLEDVFVPDEMLLGDEGRGWELITAELSFERSGPERFLSVMPLFAELVRLVGPEPAPWVAAEIGTLTAELWTLRRMSLAVGATLDAGRDPMVEAAVVKDLGTRFEQRTVEVSRTLAGASDDAAPAFRDRLAEATLAAPGFTLRGGTNEILRGLVCRALGVRA